MCRGVALQFQFGACCCAPARLLTDRVECLHIVGEQHLARSVKTLQDNQQSSCLPL
jgi:hypothetical protein